MTTSVYQASPAFQNAAAYLSSASSLSKVATATKLELYGLFKCVNVAKDPNTSRPSIFDMTGRAKWDAWAAAGKKYGNIADAEKRYLELAISLGWKEDTSTEAESSLRQALADVKPPQQPDEVDLENLSEEDEPEAGSSHSSMSGGLGVNVSTLNHKDESHQSIDYSLHGLAVSGDVTALRLLLDSSPGNLDALDEYGYAPLHLACDRGHVEVVKLLLARGANKYVKDSDGLTPLELSQEAGRADIASILESSG